MKKVLVAGITSLFLLSGCGNAEEEKDSVKVPDTQSISGESKAIKNEEPTVKKNESLLEGHESYTQEIEELYVQVIKFYQEDTGKLIYVFDGSQSSGVAMVDGSPEETISKNFLERIEIVESENLYTTTIIFRDKDNGNIITITDGSESGGIDVQKANPNITNQ